MEDWQRQGRPAFDWGLFVERWILLPFTILLILGVLAMVAIVIASALGVFGTRA